MVQVDGLRYPLRLTLCILQYLLAMDLGLSISSPGERLLDFCYSESDKNEEAQAQLVGCARCDCACDSGWQTLERFA